MSEEYSNNVYEFMQNSTSTKTYRHDYPMTEELMDELLGEVYLPIYKQTYFHHYENAKDRLLRFVREHEVPNTKQEKVIDLVFWWKILYEMQHDEDFDEVYQYKVSHQAFLNKRPILSSWLKEWYKIYPKFYYVSDQFALNGSFAVDCEKQTITEILFPHPMIQPPKKYSIIVAILLPYCDSLYFPLCDYYVFDDKVKREIAPNINFLYQELDGKDHKLDQFMHMFSSVLRLEQLYLDNITSRPNDI
ncbi:hypothetical protein ACTWQB_02055 [Piscibacillus sp. B03]|uniref:hypothetical protein n=1 Tax=Piscibacillus sp. B03 TaxID=3457430 RepID=UPI003FCDA870